MRVRHPTFGVGSIYQVEGDGEMQKVSVVFNDQTFQEIRGQICAPGNSLNYSNDYI